MFCKFQFINENEIIFGTVYCDYSYRTIFSWSTIFSAALNDKIDLNHYNCNIMSGDISSGLLKAV